MDIETRQFGKVTIDDEKIIIIPKGLPGFPDLIQYILLDHDDIHPFHSLQSVEDKNLAFYIMDPFLFKADYNVNIESYMEEMAWDKDDKEEIYIYVILNIGEEDPKKITANMIGPLLINTKKNQAVQMLVNDRQYSHKYYIFNDAGKETATI